MVSLAKLVRSLMRTYYSARLVGDIPVHILLWSKCTWMKLVRSCVFGVRLILGLVLLLGSGWLEMRVVLLVLYAIHV